MQETTIYPWLERNWQQLQAYIRQQRIPQALLINGGAGMGRLQLVELYAQTLLCQSPNDAYLPCGDCQSCRLFAAQTHPDYIFIEPEEAGKAIGIDCIRQLIARLGLKPQFQSQRVVVINSADSLNNAASNAFLKCLEI